MSQPHPAVQPPFKDRKRFYWHEFGHYVVARALGFSTNGIEIERNPNQPQGLIGKATMVPYRSIPNAAWYLRRRIAVIFGGVCAQDLRQNLSRKHTVNPYEASASLLQEPSDHEKSAELLYALRNINHSTTVYEDISVPEKELLEIHGDLMEKTIKVVEENADIIIALADKTGYPVDGWELPESDLSIDADVSKIRKVEDF
jgi:hypothetical protein